MGRWHVGEGREKRILPHLPPFPSITPMPFASQCPCQLLLGGSQLYWLGVWVLVPAGWVQILALPLISHATSASLLNLLVP